MSDFYFWLLVFCVINLMLNLFLLRSVGELHARITEVDSWHAMMGKKLAQQHTKFTDLLKGIMVEISRGKPAGTQDATLGHGPEQK